MKLITVAAAVTLVASGACAFQVASSPGSLSSALKVASLDDSSLQSSSSNLSPYEQYMRQRGMGGDMMSQQQAQQIQEQSQQQYQQQVRSQQDEISSSFGDATPGSRPSSWKDTISEALQSFKEFRELEAAGLVEEGEDLTAAKRKAAENFADFANQELTALQAKESILTSTAAKLGRTTARIFGGSAPENYRD